MRRFWMIAAAMLVAQTAAAQAPLDLTRATWRISKGDDLRWSQPAFDDRRWAMTPVPSAWETLAGWKDYDGFGWYRTRFDAPAALLGGGPLVLRGGRIDDADETFLNGQKLGATGAFPPNAASEWNTARVYPIPAGLLKATGNVLAVRVHDSGGGGGIQGGPIDLMTRAMHDTLTARAARNAATPHRSWTKLPIANGFGAAVVDAATGEIEAFRPHMYKAIDSTREVSAVLGRAWLTSAGKPIGEPTAVRYEAGTGIVRLAFSGGIEAVAFAPMSVDGPVVCVLVRGATEPTLKTSGEKAGFGVRPLGFAGGWTGFVLDARTAATGVSSETAAALPIGSGDVYLAAEQAFWAALQGRAKLPPNLSGDRAALYRQSLAVLKMAQVREPGRGNGQILASLPPGQWNIAWVRDGAYAVAGLSKAGLFPEAKAALTFLMTADAGKYVQMPWKGKDYGVGVPYQISVTRYFGDGTEESDATDEGPNMELDGFGMSLWAVEGYVRASGDTAFVRQHWPTLSTKVADALIGQLDPTTGLIRADSGPWERHLPGKVYTYTQANAVRGLEAAVTLAGWAKDRPAQDRYRLAAARLGRNVLLRLTNDQRELKASLSAVDPSAHEYYDAGAVEAITLGVVDPTGSVAKATLAAFDRALRIPTRPVGFMRVNAGDWYDRQEWVVLDLRMAAAFQLAGQPDRAAALMDWVTGQSAANFNLMAELYDETTADYTGAVPMCGFGPGAYLLTAWELAK